MDPKVPISHNTKALATGNAARWQGYAAREGFGITRIRNQNNAATPESINKIVENCGSELIDGEFIQSKEQILHESKYFQTTNQTISQLLDVIIKNIIICLCLEL